METLIGIIQRFPNILDIKFKNLNRSTGLTLDTLLTSPASSSTTPFSQLSRHLDLLCFKNQRLFCCHNFKHSVLCLMSALFLPNFYSIFRSSFLALGFYLFTFLWERATERGRGKYPQQSPHTTIVLAYTQWEQGYLRTRSQDVPICKSSCITAELPPGPIGLALNVSPQRKDPLFTYLQYPLLSLLHPFVIYYNIWFFNISFMRAELCLFSLQLYFLHLEQGWSFIRSLQEVHRNAYMMKISAWISKFLHQGNQQLA